MCALQFLLHAVFSTLEMWGDVKELKSF